VLGEVRWTPSAVDLFRFSAVTWNAHRIHFDLPYAQGEGYSGIVVQAHLHGARLSRAVLGWLGPSARLTQLKWQNRAPVLAGEHVLITGTVAACRLAGDRMSVQVAIEERDADGGLRVTGSATADVPVDQGE
jgi:hydroxyacyl-ACP dehydratase HTD2-like protein with hotdog domain